MSAAAAFKRARRSRVIVEFNSGDWLVLFEDGTIRAFETPAAVLAAVQALDKRRVNARGSSGVSITTIEWRNMPDGFVPPKSGGAR